MLFEECAFSDEQFAAVPNLRMPSIQLRGVVSLELQESGWQ